MEKENFEDSLKNAFNQAEVNPSESVWTNIELDLEKAESGRMRRSLLFFKMLAAASVVFALGVGSTMLYMTQQPNNNNISQTTSQKENSSNEPLSNKMSDLTVKEDKNSGNDVTETPGSESEQSDSGKRSTALTNAEDDVQENDHALLRKNTDEHATQDANMLTDDSRPDELNSLTKNPQVTTEESSLISSRYSTAANNSDESSDLQPTSSAKTWKRGDASSILLTNNTTLPALVRTQKPGIILPKEEPADPVAVMLARLDQEEQQVRASAEKKDRKKNLNEEKLWTSVGFAAGSFNSLSSGVSAQTSNMVLARNSQIADNEANASGTAYSVGVNMGAKISNRWVLQGGVNYMTQSSDYVAQAAVGAPDLQSFRPASVVEFNKLNDVEGQQDKLVSTAPYNVNNNVQYISLPLQAGFMIINKKFGLQLNAGVATDLFLQNTKSADNESFDKVTQGRGADSPYRPFNFSGLAGTELSYRFGSRYRLALNPGIRYPFRSIYKSEAGIESTPVTFDVGLRFRYIFH